jgi:hypothetical protein
MWPMNGRNQLMQGSGVHVMAKGKRERPMSSLYRPGEGPRRSRMNVSTPFSHAEGPPEDEPLLNESDSEEVEEEDDMAGGAADGGNGGADINSNTD